MSGEAAYRPINRWSGAILVGGRSVAYVVRPGRARAVNVRYQDRVSGQVITAHCPDTAAACALIQEIMRRP